MNEGSPAEGFSTDDSRGFRPSHSRLPVIPQIVVRAYVCERVEEERGGKGREN